MRQRITRTQDAEYYPTRLMSQGLNDADRLNHAEVGVLHGPLL